MPISQQKSKLSRSQLIGGLLASGALAACRGGGANSTLAVAPTCNAAAPTPSAGRFGVNDIFSHPSFNCLDKPGLLTAFDRSPNLDALHQGYFGQSGQQPQKANVIQQIPSGGIVIQSPGTYTLAGNIAWNPNNVSCSAITIQASNVTLDFAGFTLKAAVADKSQQIAGVVVAGPASNVTIANGTIAGVAEYGILARNVCGLTISSITVTGVCMQNLAVRFLTPAGIHISYSNSVSILACNVTQLGVTTDSCAGIQLMGTNLATVSGCSITGMVNNDGAVQGYSYIGCTNVTTIGCTADSFQSFFNGNVLTTGHTVIGYCPIFCQQLSFQNCSASRMTGSCDDCHGMSVFLDAQVTVSGFRASQILDGVSPSNSGAKATGLEVYGAGVRVTDCAVTSIRAINPQDRQATGFSAWGALIAFQRCTATNVSVQNDIGGARGMGFGWAPDPRVLFRCIGAFAVSYTDCTAQSCDVGFDTWFHILSTWIRPTYTNCTVNILVEPGGQRTVSGNPCSECSPPITATLTNIASGNTYPS